MSESVPVTHYDDKDSLGPIRSEIDRWGPIEELEMERNLSVSAYAGSEKQWSLDNSANLSPSGANSSVEDGKSADPNAVTTFDPMADGRFLFLLPAGLFLILAFGAACIANS